MDVPIATRGLPEGISDAAWVAIRSVYLLYCPGTRNKGTGFALRGGPLVTAEHVVRGCPLEKLMAVSSEGTAVSLKRLVVDARRDLALAFPVNAITGGLLLAGDVAPRVGVTIFTLGYPSPYHGPVPVITVGRLSGFRDHRISETEVDPAKHLVVNGAFKAGNSGGPLFVGQDNRVIGVLVSRHVSRGRLRRSAHELLMADQAGAPFTTTDVEGNSGTCGASQKGIEARLCFRELAQAIIAEAVAVSELRALLQENNLVVPE
ncbi:MAG: trypsin-like peptidase domain-containing protein [Nitrospinae bacterium]|nr:trypsin-like peptidase domain-containing protein [Nitrospinota bacterium]